MPATSFPEYARLIADILVNTYTHRYQSLSKGTPIMPLEEATWISEHQDEVEQYAGKWIAVLKDRVIATGYSVVEVMEKVEQQTSELPLVVKVPRKGEGPYVL